MDGFPSSYPELNLTASPRPLETEGNLFVRLAPRTAWRLASLLLSPSTSHDDDQVSLQDVPEVEFLPLEIVISQRGLTIEGTDGTEDVGDGSIVVYASYNGGAPASPAYLSRPYGSMANDGIIELPLDLHPSLASVFNSTSEPVLASVRPLSDVPVSERVTIEPLNCSDWEMIEMEASALEDGGLLNQITVVSPGQIFPLRLGGRSNGRESAAWVKVVDGFSPSNQNIDCDASYSSDSDFDSSIDSSTDEDNSHLNGRRHKCVRLMAETEIEVIPKPRKRKEDPVEKGNSNRPSHAGPVYSPSAPLRVQPIGSCASNAVSTAEGSPSLPNPSLGSVCVHPSTLKSLHDYHMSNKIQCQSDEHSDLKVELLPTVVTIRKVSGPYAKRWPYPEADEGRGTGGDAAVATIRACNNTHVGHIGMHELLCYQLGVSPLACWVSVQFWSESHVTNSVNDVRDRPENIEIAKVSITAPPEERSHSLHPLKSPDGCSTVVSLVSDVAHSTCEFCNETKLDKDSSATGAVLFTSGSLVPLAFLQSLGFGWLEQHCPHNMFILKLPSTMDSLESSDKDSTDRKNNLPPDTSRLIPVFTARDLKKLSNPVDAHRIDELKTFFLDARGLSPVLSFSGEPTDFFSCAIQSAMLSASEIMMPRAQTPIPFLSESIHKHAIMISGEEGAGKSHLSMTLSSKFLSDLRPTIYLDCKKLQATSGSSIQSILEEIQRSFQEAMYKQPSVLVLDDLDVLIPNVGSSNAVGDGSIHHQQLNPALGAQVKIIVDHLLLQSRYCQRSAQYNGLLESTGVILICTCNDKDSLCSRYQESGVFQANVEVPSLNSSQRAQFMRNHVFGNSLVSSKDERQRLLQVFSRLGKDTDGFRPRDLKTVATRIVHSDYLRNFNQTPNAKSRLAEPDEARKPLLKLLELDIASIIEDYTPLCQKLVGIDRNSCSMDWASVGGLYKVKQSLYDIIIHPMKFKPVYDNAPIELPTGVLLYGPPGNGKSFIIPLLAKKSKLNLITCRGPELLDRYIGASEAKVRQLFARATAAAPAMIFFDEFDSLAPQRGSDRTGVTDRVVNQLLTLIDGAERNKKAGHVYIVAATSRPDKIDKALLRPGRLEKHVYVGYPESPVEWNSLFSSLLKTRDVDEEMSQCGNLFNSFCQDFGYAKDFSAADMKAVLETAHLLCVHDLLDTNNDGAHGPAILRKCHILEAFRKTRPSLQPKDRRMLQNIYSSFGSNQMEEDSPDQPNGHRLKTALR